MKRKMLVILSHNKQCLLCPRKDAGYYVRGVGYREEQDVILGLQKYIILPSNIPVGTDFYNSMLEHSEAIFLSPRGYIRLQGGMELSPNPSDHHIALATDWHRDGHVPNSANDKY